MWSFLKQIFAVIIGLFLFTFLFILVLLGIAAGVSAGDKIATVEPNSILVLNFNKPILEQEIENPFEDLDLPIGNDEGGDGVIQIKEAIEAATFDENIKGIYLSAGDINAGASQIDEIRESLIQFKISGKFVYAYAESYSEAAYYLASVADSIFLNPVGLLELNGISNTYPFFKGTLDKLGLEVQVFKVGKFKSAVEPFILDKMSEANKTQTLSYLSSLNSYHLNQIAISRNLDENRIKIISDSMLVHNPLDAKRLGIVDELLYYDQVLAILKKKSGIKESEKIKFISYSKYKNTYSNTEDVSENNNKVAIIVAEGEIESGNGDEKTIGSDKIAEEIRKARLDNKVKAVVLRINSPGGSALASDIMWREVTLTAAKKPIIASMSDVAASGGYYMAMGCTKIVARPNAITGSIGVFGLVLNAQNFMKDKIGITFDGVKTGKFSDVGTLTRPCTPYEKMMIQKEVESIYTDFVSKAAKGRKMSFEKLENLASGRVWSGIEAKENGLVDQLGGLYDAIDLAVETAKLDSNYVIEYRPKKKEFLEKIFSSMSADAKIRSLKAELGLAFGDFLAYEKIKKHTGIQARLPLGVGRAEF